MLWFDRSKQWIVGLMQWRETVVSFQDVFWQVFHIFDAKFFEVSFLPQPELYSISARPTPYQILYRTGIDRSQHNIHHSNCPKMASFSTMQSVLKSLSHSGTRYLEILYLDEHKTYCLQFQTGIIRIEYCLVSVCSDMLLWLQSRLCAEWAETNARRRTCPNHSVRTDAGVEKQVGRK